MITIKYIGHSCFEITLGNKKIVTDPYGKIGFMMPPLCADVTTVSHSHYDHNNVDAITAKNVLSTVGEYQIDAIKFTAINSFHDEVQGKKRGQNLIFKIEGYDYTLCHLGDLGESCHLDLVEKLRGITLLFIPVGGTYTIDAQEAKKYVEAIRPRYVIPMHYHSEGLQVDIASLDQFISLFDKDEVLKIGGDTVQLKDENLFENQTKMIVLERFQYGK